jgi:thiamine pyrophosphate-dependent acetolactate synthase large subunit-like protein
MTCAEAIADILATHGPPTIFGYPGAHTVKLHAAIARHPRLSHVLVRHEQGAAFAADGYARVSGGPGVFLTTAGPGATNAVTAVTESFTNSVPTVHLCCLVDRPFVGKTLGAWHEADIEAVFRPVTKWSATAREADEAPRLVLRALQEATTGRPRPTQVCIPRDLLHEPGVLPEVEDAPRTHAPGTQQVNEAARLIAQAERPVVIAGGGAVRAAEQIRSLARLIGTGVATTCMGKGVFPDDDSLSLGACFSNAGAAALAEADVCLAVGCRFTQIATRNWTTRIPLNLIHIDVDRSVIDMHYPARVRMEADAGETLGCLLGELTGARQPDRGAWVARVAELREADRQASGDEIELCRLLRKAIPRETLVVGDVASLVYGMFVHFDAYEPASFLYPAGYIAMGYGLPAAIGAQLARPDGQVVCIAGDGSFSMSLMELATVAQNAIPVKIVLLNNDCLGSIAHFAGEDRPDLEEVVALQNPDFVSLANAYGIPADRIDVRDRCGLSERLTWLQRQEGPALLEVNCPAPR